MRREVQGLRELLECQLASLAWNELSRSNPMQVTVLQKLNAMGYDSVRILRNGDEYVVYEPSRVHLLR